MEMAASTSAPKSPFLRFKVPDEEQKLNADPNVQRKKGKLNEPAQPLCRVGVTPKERPLLACRTAHVSTIRR